MESRADVNPVRLVYAVILGCMLIGYAIFRWISNLRASGYGTKLVKALDTSPELADEVVEDYQNQYAKVPKGGSKPIKARLAEIQKGGLVLKKYEILGGYPLRNDGLLLVTLCRNPEVGERGGEVVKKYVFVFVIQHSKSGEEIEVCSDYFEVLSDKFLRQDFAQFIAEKVEKNG